MATADHVKALIRSHAAGDDERFYAIACRSLRRLLVRGTRSSHRSP